MNVQKLLCSKQAFVVVPEIRKTIKKTEGKVDP